jgi:pyruvate dehydrogenase E1 component beta subunit
MTMKSGKDAIREALREEMERDDRVFVMGTDIGAFGGDFRTTAGLIDTFGPRRIRDTPISEAAISGAAVGAAAAGLRPVLEMSFIDFLGCCMDEIMNQAAKSKYMFGGQLTLPIVWKGRFGAGASHAAHHSQSLEAVFANIPGLRNVVPSSPRSFKGLLKAAIRDNNPVIYMEHKLLYSMQEDIPEGDVITPIGKCEVVRSGSDCTLMSWGRMTGLCTEAALLLADEGVSCEVIDVLSIKPFDKGTVLSSVRRTSRAVIVHEAPVFGGFGAEISAIINEEAFGWMDAPVRRVGFPDAPVPFSPVLEQHYLPKAASIAEAVRRCLRD